MRKVELRMKEELKYLTIKKLVETNGSKKRAAIKLDCSIRSINRMIVGYKLEGKEFFLSYRKLQKSSSKKMFATRLKKHILKIHIKNWKYMYIT